jgi:hypothetical protein
LDRPSDSCDEQRWGDAAKAQGIWFNYYDKPDNNNKSKFLSLNKNFMISKKLVNIL